MSAKESISERWDTCPSTSCMMEYCDDLSTVAVLGKLKRSSRQEVKLIGIKVDG